LQKYLARLKNVRSMITSKSYPPFDGTADLNKSRFDVYAVCEKVLAEQIMAPYTAHTKMEVM
jgi:hypothetical protein